MRWGRRPRDQRDQRDPTDHAPISLGQTARGIGPYADVVAPIHGRLVGYQQTVRGNSLLWSPGK
jgi:hypothetical protein